MFNREAIEAILNFWFADIGNGFVVGGQQKLWYGGCAEIDREIERLFGDYVENALDKKLNEWCSSAQGAMALILLLDQFTRNMYRGTARAFAGDDQAKQVLKNALSNGLDKDLSFVQRSFFYMPLEHSESLDDQEYSINLFKCLLAEVPDSGRPAMQSSYDFALKHREIIEKFGRFPHRNKALNRSSTEQEVDYLNNGGARFGQ